VRRTQTGNRELVSIAYVCWLAWKLHCPGVDGSPGLQAAKGVLEELGGQGSVLVKMKAQEVDESFELLFLTHLTTALSHGLKSSRSRK